MLYEGEFPLCHLPAHASHGHIQPLGRGLHAIEFVLGIVALAALCEWRGRFLDVLLEHFVLPTERVSGTGPQAQQRRNGSHAADRLMEDCVS
jgi:hypothetical protein